VAGKRSKAKKRPSRSRKKPKKKSRPVRRRLLYWGAVLTVWAAIVGAIAIGYYAITLPDVSTLGADRRRPTITLLGKDGSVLETHGDLYGETVTFQRIPPHLVNAVIATEDRRFYDHPGIDVIGLARAMVANLRAGRIVQGGSTVTQQLAKNLFLTPERTLGRKVREVMLAVWLERQFSKQEIMSLYLNRVYFGAGSYGIDGAARRYFGIGAGQLSLSQSAMLAGLLKAPTRYAPTRNLKRSWRRTAQVLDNMVAAGHLTSSKAEHAKAHPARPRKVTAASDVRYFTNWVMDRLPDYVSPGDRDLTVVTTLDPKLQSLAESAMKTALQRESARAHVSQGALTALGMRGGVRAMVGGRAYKSSQFNRATQARRQPGSAFKVFVYLTAFERGLTPDTVMRDSPLVLGDWKPQNYQRAFVGDVTLRDAFSKSINTVAVKVSERAGRHRVIKTARRLGITSPIPPGPSVALGTAGVSLLELTSAYGVIANGGFGVIPHGIDQVRDREGNVLYHREGSGPGRVVERGHVNLMTGLLRTAVETGTGKAARLQGRAAGKTGTSQDFRDAWFVGFADDLAAGVWFGNDDGRPMKKVTGGGLPARTWQKFMSGAIGSRPPDSAPPPETLGFFQRLFGGPD
jgi:penicillin-binding protein 1A